MKRNIMRKKLLLGTVALMAGVGLASAQGMREGPGEPSKGEHGLSSGSFAAQHEKEVKSPARGKTGTHGEGIGSAQRGASDHDLSKGQAKSERAEKSTTGQGASDENELKSKTQSSRSGERDELKSKSPGAAKSGEKATTGQAIKEKDGTHKNSARKGESSTTGQASHEKNERSTTGQGTSESGQNKTQNQHNEPSQMNRQSGQQNQTTGAASPAQSGATIRSQAGTQISSQQQITIRESVLSRGNVPRVDHVGFSIHTGIVVPRDVHVVSVTTFPALIEVFPRYRDYSFFVVEDEIVFVDRGHRIVDVVAVGPRSRFSSSSTTSTTVDLSEPEIREIQQVLIQRGYFHGRVDGVFGPELREALITFQRREGIETSGRIDTRTVGALGLSGKIKAEGQVGSESSTMVEQGRSETQQRSNQQNTTGQNPNAQQGTSGQSSQMNSSSSQKPSTSGQDQTSGRGKNGSQEPSAQPDKSGQATPQSRSTTGQGSTHEPSGSKEPGMSNHSSGSSPGSSVTPENKKGQ
jgi:peptidoglycan hydrolase-like protein with peptidoglycan-binding domain